MRFLLRIASRSARAAACHRAAARCGLSRAIDSNSGSVLRRVRAGRADARWCAAPTPSSSLRRTRRRRERRSRVRCIRMRTPCEPPAHAKPSATTRRVFVREVLFGSRARDDITRSRRGEKTIIVHHTGIAIVALGFEASTSNFAGVSNS